MYKELPNGYLLGGETMPHQPFGMRHPHLAQKFESFSSTRSLLSQKSQEGKMYTIDAVKQVSEAIVVFTREHPLASAIALTGSIAITFFIARRFCQRSSLS